MEVFKMTVKTEYQAWEAVTALFPDEYKKDEESSAKAGAGIYKVLRFLCQVALFL